MKAITFNEYGGPDVLAWTDVPDPPVGPDIVLIHTRVAGVNPADWKAREGNMAGALPTHFPVIPGWDVAGIVAAVGVGVHEYAVGDEVIGYARRDHLQYGTYAELVPVPAHHHPQTKGALLDRGGQAAAGRADRASSPDAR